MARWTASDIPDQRGRTIVITGANSGLGLRSAEALARHGATVVMACRDADRAEAARSRVAAVAAGPAPQVVALDLADLASVRKAAEQIAERADRLDVLMNNAGVMAPPLQRTADGFELQFGTNHLGHFALTGLLLPLLLRSPSPRVVTTSSLTHRAGSIVWDDPDGERPPYDRWAAYAGSKLANLLFMRELARQAAEAGSGLVSVAAHPGYAATRLPRTTARQTGGRLVARLALVAVVVGGLLVAQSATAGARPQLYAATMPGVASGGYLGPRGRFELRGSPAPARLAAAARDDASARRLWALSQDLTGVTYEW